MANWSDPRTTAVPRAATGARDAAFDAGLRSYMLSVYNYMASGVLLTGIVAMLFANSPYMGVLFDPFGRPNLLGMVVMFAPLGLVMAMSFGMQRMQESTIKALYWVLTVAMGLSLSTIFLRYTGGSIAQTFFATAIGFGGLSLYGYTTKRDLAPFGTFLTMALFGLIAASLINMFVHSQGMDLIISFVGVLLFAGLTAFDTQRIKSTYYAVRGTSFYGKSAVMGALQLYLDFVNMFLFLLRFMGNQRN
ncbi:Bax inhibitor-1/YccA family protein [Sphingomonas abietis]|uniref:Bax inhibitor-1/YccA family protein n=1 Tax=Sphingomonas abietis TaxID=3012344 RepID=A0ABY7NKL0_9SPHN|nr:Bax inhibitor-1/YccA family protein [Sphingomonas abietis]WBO22077.1 Bax inhibitor-1/YccA family protein [Sphingomonas abietis]